MKLLLRTKKSKYWVDIWDDMQEEGIDYDGYWVAFLRRNIRKDDGEKKIFEDKVWGFLEETGLPGARISLPYYDRLIVFTTCDKSEILKAKLQMQEHLGINSKHLIWKASFESEYQWKRGNWLNLMAQTFDRYESQLSKNKISITYDIVEARSLLYQNILEETTMKRESMVVRPKFRPIDYQEKSNSVFVLMPFSENWSDGVYHLIKQAALRAGFSVARADDFFEPNIIIDDIWKNINSASIIIADITVHNANVFYELGIAHTIGKEVILTRQHGGKAAPFDIAYWRYVEYGIGPIEADEFISKLEKILLTRKT